jgi:hypothetical protein
VNLFVCGISSERLDGDPLRAAVTAFLAQLPFFDSDQLDLWLAPTRDVVVACVSQAPDRIGPISTHCFEDERMALFSGRPIIWTARGEADGRAPLNPRRFLEETTDWEARLDGRYVVIRYDHRTLTVVTDRLGSYPVYLTKAGTSTWIGNNVELLRRVSGHGSDPIDPTALASFIGCGFSLGGGPLHSHVRRLPRGTSMSYAEGKWTDKELFPVEDIGGMFGKHQSATEAGRVLSSATRALGDWPERPIVVSVTGGQDSRLVFAAGLRGGLEFQARTIADPMEPRYPATGRCRRRREALRDRRR